MPAFPASWRSAVTTGCAPCAGSPSSGRSRNTHRVAISNSRLLEMQGRVHRSRQSPCAGDLGRDTAEDEHAVGAALEAGQIAGAAFDVVSVEPPPADHPFMALLGRPDFLLTPHVAWASDEAIQRLADQLIDNFEAFAGNTPVNVVGDPARK